MLINMLIHVENRQSQIRLRYQMATDSIINTRPCITEINTDYFFFFFFLTFLFHQRHSNVITQFTKKHNIDRTIRKTLIHLQNTTKRALFFRRCLAWPRERSNLVFADNVPALSRPGKTPRWPTGSRQWQAARGMVRHASTSHRYNTTSPALASVHMPRSGAQVASPGSKFTWRVGTKNTF